MCTFECKKYVYLTFLLLEYFLPQSTLLSLELTILAVSKVSAECSVINTYHILKYIFYRTAKASWLCKIDVNILSAHLSLSRRSWRIKRNKIQQLYRALKSSNKLSYSLIFEKFPQVENLFFLLLEFLHQTNNV